ncbi:MAG: hypothetical protein U9Q84_00495 [Thermodesulfobacteriota bacterium]|nr:hypothetical protein [Thermodesulfobacteriota bacterium]
MPRSLKRAAGYGWSYAMGKGQRVPSTKYKKNFDKIKWKKHNTDEWDVKKVYGERGGLAIIKKY